MPTSELHERLRAARQSARLSMQDVADAVGRSRAAIGLWESPNEKNRTVPSLKMLQRVAKVTGAPYDWLTSDDSEIRHGWRERLATEAKQNDFVPVPVITEKVIEVLRHLNQNPTHTAAQAAELAGVAPVSTVCYRSPAHNVKGFYHDRYVNY